MSSVKTITGRDPGRGTDVEVTFDQQSILSIRELPPDKGRQLPVLAPGFVDGQVNGFDGLDINAANVTANDIIALTGKLARIGVTTWVPTIVTATEEAILHALDQVAAARDADPTTRVAIPSVHVEGPFISDRDGPRGIHNAAAVRPLDANEVQRWQQPHGLVGIVTVSPHTADATEQITKIRRLGIEVAIGHTHAAPEQISAAAAAGARLATHLGNGIATTLPRHPNALWTQLADDRLTAGLIADGHHLPLDTLKVMIRAKTPERAYLVSDSTALAGQKPGRYDTTVGGTVDLSPDGKLSYLGTDLLAGAAASLPDGFRTVLNGVGLAFADALKLVTSTPANVIPGTRQGLGRLRVGSPADFVRLTVDGPGAGSVVSVIQSGLPVNGGPE